MNRRQRDWIAGCLRTVPSSDINFKSSLENANNRMLQGALIWLQARPKDNTSRILAVQRELRRREKRKTSG
jgi:hypothetical protein